jgi:hypothetical protein
MTHIKTSTERRDPFFYAAFYCIRRPYRPLPFEKLYRPLIMELGHDYTLFSFPFEHFSFKDQLGLITECWI